MVLLTTGGGRNFQLTGSQFGGNLDAVLELRNSAGRLIVTSAPAGTLGATIVTTLAAGKYYLAARGAGAMATSASTRSAARCRPRPAPARRKSACG